MSSELGGPEGIIPRLSGSKSALLRLLSERGARNQGEIRSVPRMSGGQSLSFSASSAQKRLWFIEPLEGAKAGYRITISVRLSGELDTDGLKEALDSIAHRHETLRTVFLAEDGE